MHHRPLVVHCLSSLHLFRLSVTPRASKIVSKNIFSRSFVSSFVLFSNNMSTTSNNCLQVKLLSENATMPSKGSEFSAGFDLSSAEDTIIKSKQRGLVKTDLSIACPPNTYARIAPRSGLAVKKGIDVGAGVVDADYRGPVGVVLFNFGEEDFVVSKGDRIAQLILEEISMVPAVQVEELTETARGEGGFGSTGIVAKKARTISPAVGEGSNEKTNMDE
jgi:deoxyuridine 5'-triphosphate nucleotidohydrolase